MGGIASHNWILQRKTRRWKSSRTPRKGVTTTLRQRRFGTRPEWIPCGFPALSLNAPAVGLSGAASTALFALSKTDAESFCGSGKRRPPLGTMEVLEEPSKEAAEVKISRNAVRGKANRALCQRKVEMSPFVQSRNVPFLPAGAADEAPARAEPPSPSEQRFPRSFHGRDPQAHRSGGGKTVANAAPLRTRRPRPGAALMPRRAPA